MLDQITIVDITNNGLYFKGRKPAKLSTFENFYNKAKAFMLKVQGYEQRVETTLNSGGNISQVVEDKKEISRESKLPETNGTSNVIQLPSDEEYNRRLMEKGVTCYSTLPEGKLSAPRKLRVAYRVIESLRKVRSTVAEEYPRGVSLTSDEQVIPKKTFDFSKQFSQPQADYSGSNEPKSDISSKVEEEKPYSWLRKEDRSIKPSEVNNDDQILGEGDKSNTDISNMSEFQKLMEQRVTISDSLAAKKELLLDLRKKVEKNSALCEAKKLKLIKENLDLTQELNAILDEINELTRIASQQEDFLDSSEENLKK